MWYLLRYVFLPADLTWTANRKVFKIFQEDNQGSETNDIYGMADTNFVDITTQIYTHPTVCVCVSVCVCYNILR